MGRYKRLTLNDIIVILIETIEATSTRKQLAYKLGSTESAIQKVIEKYLIRIYVRNDRPITDPEELARLRGKHIHEVLARRKAKEASKKSKLPQ